jgi:signal transduction histidine kinase
MMTRTFPDALDTRTIFRGYAVVAWVAGASLWLLNPIRFALGLSLLPGASALPLRVAGAAVAAAGCFAFALVGVDDPAARRRGLAWLAWGHVVVLAATIFEVLTAAGGPGLAWQIAFAALSSAVWILWHFWWYAGGLPPGGLPSHEPLFGAPGEPSTEQLRSTYEEQIRTAAAQEERNRLARDLHDSIKQQIFAIQTAAATAQARFDSDRTGAGAAIQQVRSSARDAMTEMEVMLDQLRAAPLENTGLVEALKKQCETLGFRTGADVQFTVGALPPNESLPPGSQQAVFRMAQEALANVARHARAKHVTVNLDSTPYSLVLRVEDDGVGFDAESPTSGMGVSGMRARAAGLGGFLNLRSQPGGGGTLVRISVPRLTDEKADPRFYRRRAVLFGGLLLFQVAYTVWAFTREHDPVALAVLLPPAALLGALLAQACAGYLRLRRKQVNG